MLSLARYGNVMESRLAFHKLQRELWQVNELAEFEIGSQALAKKKSLTSDHQFITGMHANSHIS